MKKRLLTLFLVLTMVLGLTTTVFAGPGGCSGGHEPNRSIDLDASVYSLEDYDQN